MKRSALSSKSGISVTELVIVIGLTTGVAFVGGYLASRSTSTSKNSLNQGLGTTSMREEIARVVRDPVQWLDYQKQAETLRGGSLANCLNPGGPYVCPANESVADPEITAQVPTGGAVSEFSLYIPSSPGAAPASLTSTSDFVTVAGSTVSPVYIGGIGEVCTGATAASTCDRVATGYFIRQNGGAGADPGAVKFIVKIARNSALATNEGAATPPTYIRINLGTAWKGPQGAKRPIPVGAILPFAGVESRVPAGYLLCDGSEVLTATYPELAAVLGTGAAPWGPATAAATSGHFRLPDLRGVYLRGIDDGTGVAVDPNRPRTVGSFQRQAVQDHTHGTNVPASPPFQLSPVAVSSVAVPLSSTVSQATVTLGAMPAGGFSGSNGWGYEYAGSPNHGVSPSGGGTATGSLSFNLPAGSAIPVASITPGAGFLQYSSAGPTTALASGAASADVRPPTASVHFIIRADYPDP